MVKPVQAMDSPPGEDDTAAVVFAMAGLANIIQTFMSCLRSNIVRK